jgi:hypothetical protein
MRTIFLLFSFLISIICLSQDGKPPTQKEIEAQKQGAIKEAKQQIVDLKKDIAEAKVAGEDLESIKEMEKQLATLENMMAMLEKTNLSGKPRVETLPPPRIVEPKYVSPFTPMVLKQPLSIPTQKEATDQLFWYKGKKIDANTLITTAGLIVRYDQKNNKIIFQPDKKTDTPYYNLINTLSRIPKLKNDYVLRMDILPNNFFMFPEIERAYKEFDLIMNMYHGIAKNTIDLQPEITEIDDMVHFEQVLGQFLLGLSQLVNNLQEIQDVELPPKRPNSLCNCKEADEDNKVYREELRLWLQERYWKEETQILRKIVGIYEHRDALLRKFKQYVDPPDFEEIINDAVLVALRRMKQKLVELAGKYQNGNIDVEDGLVFAAKSLKTRSAAGLVSFNNSEINSEKALILIIVDKIKDLVFSDIFDRRIKEWKTSRNFTEVFNYSRCLSHEYNKLVLQPSYPMNENFFNTWMEGLEKFNRFTLSMKIDFEYQQDPGGAEPLMIAKGAFQSDKIIVSLGIEDCMFNLRITDANYRNKNTDEEKFKIPLKVISGSREYVGQSSKPYTGPPTVVMLFPRFKLNFCNEESEVKLDLLTYTIADNQKHKGDDPKKVFTTDMLAYANKMFVGLVKTQSNMNELIKDASTMINMNSSTLPASTGNAVLDKLNMDYLMNKKRYDLQYTLATTTHTEKTIVKLGTLNSQGSATVIDPKAKDIVDRKDKDLVVKMTYATITLELNHTPK